MMIYEEKILKVMLMSLDNKRVLDEHYRDRLLESMMSHIGSADPVLRDHLISSNFAKLIGDRIIPQREMASLLDRCLNQDHLFFKIGEINTDSVFTRSFSSLVVALILNVDRKTSFIDNNKIQEITEKIITYLHEEKDTRGYVEEKGWAHSIAHGADMLAALVKHHHFHMESLPKVLKAIQVCLLKGTVFKEEEDERLIFVVEALLGRGMEQHALKSWLNNLTLTMEREMTEHGQTLLNYQNKITMTNFMKSLYFRLTLLQADTHLLECLENTIHYWFKKSYDQE
ncbi:MULTISPECIES: DUF2785 domain-containing protein [unclassified Sutcliffiella]|uniref:DUF2785 domain-containing protein n=1 Tax=unclassified Sutcliffiella TaxID=2837532 RepID=UPI0030CDF6DA